MRDYHDPETKDIYEEKLARARDEFKTLANRDPMLARAIFRCRLIAVGFYGRHLSPREIEQEVITYSPVINGGNICGMRR